MLSCPELLATRDWDDLKDAVAPARFLKAMLTADARDADSARSIYEEWRKRLLIMIQGEGRRKVMGVEITPGVIMDVSVDEWLWPASPRGSHESESA